MKFSRLCLPLTLLAWFTVADVRGDFLVYSIPLGGGQGQQGGSAPPGAVAGPPMGMPMPMPGAAAPGPMPGAPGTQGTQQRQQANELRIVLQGKVTVNAGGTVTYTHPTIKDQLYFSLRTVQHFKAPTTQAEYNKKVATAGKNADGVMKAAVWGLKKGLLRDFYNGVNKVLELDPNHEGAKKILELKKQMDEPLADNADLENELRAIVKRPGMRLAKSNHFLMLTDTPQKPEAGKRRNRADERLALLEQVYESFLLLFHAQDVELDIPKDRMKVVLFNDQRDYLEFATGLSPALSSASGFWEPARNVSVFYDHGTDEQFVALDKLKAEWKKQVDEAKKAKNNPELIRFVKTLDLLIEVAQENSDITVVSHEATHQMAGNTGLLPRHVMIPSWVHEGLATYFEAPGDATWAGIGAVNEERLAFYRALEKDKVHSNIEFIVGDQIFDFARSHGAKLHGYGQAWALTHFMLENHLKETVQFYRMLGDMPPDVTLNPQLLTQLFNRAFSGDRGQLDQEWRSYMRLLKTDLERLAPDAVKASAPTTAAAP